MQMSQGLRVCAARVMVAVSVVSAAGWGGGVATAQTTAPAGGPPSAEQMIEQLKAPRTRSLRNLSVEPVSPTINPSAGSSAAPNATSNSAAASAVAPEPKPSLSLLIQFDFNSARVSPESQQALSNLAQALKSDALLASKFAVEGHTDAKGRADYNLRLSQQRADAVRELLAAQGVGVERLQAVGKGATALANTADPNAAENRRVRIVNLD